jgi:EAL domain-containing protein (putative c-di-GMP-specific phosphodiesterase class I)
VGVSTIAEGVEDADTLATLAVIGIDFAQGFHLARPEPLAAFFKSLVRS